MTLPTNDQQDGTRDRPDILYSDLFSKGLHGFRSWKRFDAVQSVKFVCDRQSYDRKDRDDKGKASNCLYYLSVVNAAKNLP